MRDGQIAKGVNQGQQADHLQGLVCYKDNIFVEFAQDVRHLGSRPDRKPDQVPAKTS